jgi:hypothetical protein
MTTAERSLAIVPQRPFEAWDASTSVTHSISEIAASFSTAAALLLSLACAPKYVSWATCVLDHGSLGPQLEPPLICLLQTVPFACMQHLDLGRVGYCIR